MKTNILTRVVFCVAAITSLMVCGCTDDINTPSPHPDIPGESLEIPFKVDSDLIPARSGIPANARECNIEEAYALFFSSDAEAGLLNYKRVSVRQSTKKLGIEPPEGITADTEYKVLLIGNPTLFLTGGQTDFSSVLSGLLHMNRGMVESKLSLYFQDPMTYRNPDRLPMWGRYVSESDNDVEIPFRYSVTTDANGVESYVSTGEFRFSRTVERLDLVNLVPESLDIRWAKVCNYRNSGLAFVDGILPEGSEVVPLTEEHPDPTASAPGDYVAASEMEGGGQEIKESLYAFPNIVQASVQNDRATTCLIVAGYYIDPNTKVKDTNLTYYRFNMANIGEAQLLKRNYVYTAVIKGVKRRGSATDLEAYNDKAPIFIYDVDDEWDVTDDNYVTDGKGNFLILSKTHLTFQGTHSSADKIELKVSTNPELDWKIEPVAVSGNKNSLFTCEKFTANSLKAGPTTTNPDVYVRMGYYRVVATNKNPNAAPVNLSLNIYLMQLTIDPNFKCLTVDGCTGTVYVTLPPSGGAIYLPVATGSDLNPWVATCNKNFVTTFGDNASFLASGGNHADLLIRVDPNVSTASRTANITVRLEPNDPNVPPVILVCTQAPSKQKMILNPLPQNMHITLNGFSTEIANWNGVVNPEYFSVTMLDPLHYKFNVESSFDKYRDLKLSSGSSLENVSYASHPTVAEAAADSPYNDKLTGLDPGTRVYLNPFRTGPGDGTITGTIKVTAYDTRDPNNASKKEVQTITVQIVTPPTRIDDVVIYYSTGGTYWLFPDRSLGMRSRINDPSKRVVAKFFHPYDYVKINHDSGVEVPYYNTDFNDLPGTDYLNVTHANPTNYGVNAASGNAGNKKYNLTTPTGYLAPVQEFLKRHLDSSKRYSPFYTSTTDASWVLPGPTIWNWMATHNIVFSKWRCFAVSDVKGSVPVCCWIQYPTKSKLWNYNYSYGNNNYINLAMACYLPAYNSTYGHGQILCIDHYHFRAAAVVQGGGDLWVAVRPVRQLTSAEVNTYKTYLTRE